MEDNIGVIASMLKVRVEVPYVINPPLTNMVRTVRGFYNRPYMVYLRYYDIGIARLVRLQISEFPVPPDNVYPQSLCGILIKGE